MMMSSYQKTHRTTEDQVIMRLARNEILGVELAQGGGPPVVTGPTAPVIRRRGKGGRAITVELNALVGYGLFRHDASPGQRAVADLNEHLKHWRS